MYSLYELKGLFIFFRVILKFYYDRLVLLLISRDIFSYIFTLLTLFDLNKLELLYPFDSFLILPKDFFELENFTSFTLNYGLNFFIEFFINISLFITF